MAFVVFPIVENGVSMFLWLGHNVSTEFIQNVFGVGSLAQVNIENPLLTALDNDMSRNVNAVIRTVRRQRSRYMKV